MRKLLLTVLFLSLMPVLMNNLSLSNLARGQVAYAPLRALFIYIV